MLEFLQNLFNTNDFPSRWHCGNWSSGHGWLHIVSDTLVFGAYMAIPIALGFYLLRKKRELVFPGIFLLFAAFILSCGLTHLIDASIFWKPWYRFSGVMKLVTAVVSWATVFTLIRMAPQALALPGLAKANRELIEMIAAQRETEEKLERTNRELEEFTRVVSHDLKTPLSSALMFSKLLRDPKVNKDDDWTVKQLQELEKVLNRSIQFVQRLHTYAMAGHEEISLGPVNLESLLNDEVRPDLSQAIEESGARLEVSDLPTVLGEPNLLYQIFSNIIRNAIKYRGEREPRIQVSAREVDGFWEVSVKDNGIGIAAEKQVEIFRPFSRLNPEIEGSGVGLAVCEKLSKTLGGGISVDSKPGAGSTFKVRLRPAGS